MNLAGVPRTRRDDNVRSAHEPGVAHATIDRVRCSQQSDGPCPHRQIRTDGIKSRAHFIDVCPERDHHRRNPQRFPSPALQEHSRGRADREDHVVGCGGVCGTKRTVRRPQPSPGVAPGPAGSEVEGPDALDHLLLDARDLVRTIGREQIHAVPSLAQPPQEVTGHGLHTALAVHRHHPGKCGDPHARIAHELTRRTASTT